MSAAGLAGMPLFWAGLEAAGAVLADVAAGVIDLPFLPIVTSSLPFSYLVEIEALSASAGRLIAC